MKLEDKELLLKDLCARLPYEPVIEYVVKGITGNGHITCKLDVFHIDELLQDSEDLVEVKPYLLPATTPLHYYVAFDVAIGETDKTYLERLEI